MKGRPLHGLTYRDVVRHYGLEMCESHIGCAADFSREAHYRGRYDQHRVIHCSRLGAPARKVRLGEVLALVAGPILGHPEKQTPLWMRIYEANTWATKEAKFIWGVQIPRENSLRARRKVLKLARFSRVRLRYHHPAVYQWARIARCGVPNGSQATRKSRVESHPSEAL